MLVQSGARIRDTLVGLGREQSARSIDTDFLRTIDRDTELAVNKLSLKLEDNEFFAKAILTSPLDVDHDIMKQLLPARSSNQRLKEASDLIAASLGMPSSNFQTARGQPTCWLGSITSRNHAGVVVVTVSDEIGAYRMFETLNDRRLKASQADILKNYFYSRSGTRLQEALSAWNSVAGAVEVLGGDENEKLVTYIRHLWITTDRPTKERELASIRSTVTSQAKSLTFLNNASNKVQDYVALSNAQHEKWMGYKPTVKQNIEVLSDHLQVEQIRPLLFAVATKFSPEEAEKAFRLFVSWSVRFLIYGGRGGLLDQQYSVRAEDVGTGKITKATQLREVMAKHVPTDTEFESAFATARVSRTHLARYYLSAIEKTPEARSPAGIRAERRRGRYQPRACPAPQSVRGLEHRRRIRQGISEAAWEYGALKGRGRTRTSAIKLSQRRRSSSPRPDIRPAALMSLRGAVFPTISAGQRLKAREAERIFSRHIKSLR